MQSVYAQLTLFAIHFVQVHFQNGLYLILMIFYINSCLMPKSEDLLQMLHSVFGTLITDELILYHYV